MFLKSATGKKSNPDIISTHKTYITTSRFIFKERSIFYTNLKSY